MVCDADTDDVVREGRAAHPDVTEVDARVWWQAWPKGSADLLEGVETVAVGGQQHGMVLVDEDGDPIRDALLWNDNRSAPQAERLIADLGGPQAWADATGRFLPLVCTLNAARVIGAALRMAGADLADLDASS